MCYDMRVSNEVFSWETSTRQNFAKTAQIHRIEAMFLEFYLTYQKTALTKPAPLSQVHLKQKRKLIWANLWPKPCKHFSRQAQETLTKINKPGLLRAQFCTLSPNFVVSYQILTELWPTKTSKNHKKSCVLKRWK